MTTAHFACVVGARPNFMKMAPLLKALERHQTGRTTLIHTGQHYDESLSDVFFRELGIRAPDIHLNVGSGPHGAQTARILEAIERTLLDAEQRGERFTRLIVVGDVNSTMAAALAAAKLRIPVAHVEAGLRSFDRSMPEEINRIVTDSLSDLLFVSEPAGVANLQREGHPPASIHLVGNIMIDTLLQLLPAARARDTLARLGLEPQGYGVVTLHRPSNVDDACTLAELVTVLVETSEKLPFVFPIHPRTVARLEQFGLRERLEHGRILTRPPLGYLDFLALTSQARVIITDSGGLQEESTVLGIPCLTMRSNTERPLTVELGTSTLVGSEMELLRRLLANVLEGTYKLGQCPPLWDGQAADRVVEVLATCPSQN